MIYKLLLAFVVAATAAQASPVAPAAPGPHFASLRRDEVFLREGPTFRHRVLWIYKRRDYPVEVIASYDTWRRVRDVDGTVGWVSATMLSDRRTVLVVGRGRAALRSGGDAKSGVLAWAEPGVVAKLKSCKPLICQIVADGTAGWIEKNKIWGVSAGEIYP